MPDTDPEEPVATGRFEARTLADGHYKITR
jgi:hypothetical protein